ncbi:MAG: hypothetical protein JXA09_18215 [Anaerolineae bacterium]|nr:hypothetical protein [Anaerolineae bacterium]
MGTAAMQIEVRYAGMHLERPPKIRLFTDVALANGGAAARWVLLPDWLPQIAGAGHQAHALEVYLLGVGPRVVVGHMIGARGCQALLLPAGASIRLRQFPILFWGHEIPDQVTIEAISGAQLTIGGEPAAQWFGRGPDGSPPGYPSSEAGADVDARTLAEQREVCAAHRTANGQDLRVALTEVERVQIVIEIPA